MRINQLIVLAALAMPLSARAQGSSDTLSLQGRSIIALGFGLTGTRSVTTSPGIVAEHASGQVGSLGFAHWFRPTVAVEISTSVLNADQTVSGGNVHDNALLPILFGVSVSPQAMAMSRSIRPYASVAAGPYIHAVSDVRAGSTTNSTETVAGARLALGANWFVARHLVLGLEGNYHAVGKFDHPDAVTEKPSGFGMLASFGFAWGGR
jgi:hypothetical protein